MPRPLEGIRVVDIGISTAGPFAARLLGDLGADVVKVEPPEGENTRSLGLRYGGMGYLFHVNNYNKRSVTLEVQKPEGRRAFLDLVAHSDVVIENFAVGTMDRWGVGYSACRAANPSIVYCSVKGFGECGPLKSLRAFDTVTQALSGIMDTTGKPGDPPLKAGPSVCDLMGAAVSSMAAMAALAARRPGESTFVDTALFDMGALALLPLWPLALAGECEPLHRIGNGHPQHAPFGDYAAATGRVMVTVTTDTQWRALAGALDLDASWSVTQRRAHVGVIDARLAQWLASHDAAHAAQALQALGVPAAPILDLAQVTSSPQLAARRMVTTVEHPVYGTVPLIDTPLAVPGHARSGPWRLQPVLGEHGDALRSTLPARTVAAHTERASS